MVSEARPRRGIMGIAIIRASRKLSPSILESSGSVHIHPDCSLRTAIAASIRDS